MGCGRCRGGLDRYQTCRRLLPIQEGIPRVTASAPALCIRPSPICATDAGSENASIA